MKTIFLNATAARNGGALNILRQFLSNFPASHKLYAFVSIDPVNLPQLLNINYVYSNVKSNLKRLTWDYWGVKKWSKKNHVKPDLIISLQNTGVSLHTRQLIYYHQPIPLFNYRWNPFKKSQRQLWFYKNMYLWFVKLSIRKNTMFVTQFQWIKSKLSETLKIAPERIEVIRPGINTFSVEDIKLIPLKGDLKIFYPASSQEYKNHIEIVNAFIYLKKIKMLNDYVVYLTLNSDDIPALKTLILTHNLQEHFVFLGNTEYYLTLSYYKSCDLLLFPSCLESLGLPLLEAAFFGKKILAADLDYSREVLDGYNGVDFIPIKNPQAWAKALINFSIKKTNFSSWKPKYAKDSWTNFFLLVDRLLG